MMKERDMKDAEKGLGKEQGHTKTAPWDSGEQAEVEVSFLRHREQWVTLSQCRKAHRTWRSNPPACAAPLI